MDTTDNSINSATASVENMENYLLHNRSEIIHKLRLLSKDRCVITGYFNHGNSFLITAIVDVIKDRNVVVLDYSADEEINNKLIAADRVVFKTQHNGINAQFTSTNVVRAKFQGQTFLACDVPQEMLWVQRREYYRVRVPLSDEAICQLQPDNSTLIEVPVIDISIGGIALMDEEQTLQIEPGDVLENSGIILPDDVSANLTLEVRSQIDINQGNKSSRRFGCMFIETPKGLTDDVQRYINHVDSIRRRTDS